MNLLSPSDYSDACRLLRTALLAVAVALLGRAIQLSNGVLFPNEPPRAAYWLCAAVIVSLTSMFAPLPRVSLVVAQKIAVLVGTIAVIVNFAQFGTKFPAFHIDLKTFDDLAPFLGGILAAAVLAGVVITANSAQIRQLVFATLLVIVFALGFWTIRKSPGPGIDVFVFQRDAVAALANGVDPYTIRFSDIYAGTATWYTPGMSVNGVLQFGYQYMPISLLAILPAQFLGHDFRVAHLVAIIFTAILIALARPRRMSYIAAILFVSTPREFFVLEQGWTEPVQVLLLAATVFCCERMPKLMPVTLGLLIASKQYMLATVGLVPLLVPAAPPDDGGSPRAVKISMLVLKSLLVAAAVTLPFVLWNPKAFWNSAIALHARFPYRSDALSFLAWWGHGNPAWIGPWWPGFAALLAGIGVSLWRGPRGSFGFAGCLAICFLLFFAFGKHAFANYYYFVIGAMCCAIALADPERPRIRGGNSSSPSLA